jgi:uncharacterized protein DUF1566
MSKLVKASRRFSLVVGILFAASMMVGVHTTEAAFTMPACLAKKLQAWGKLRGCQAAERGKALQGLKVDLTKCSAKFDADLLKLDAKAASSSIGCRYGDNGDGTVTDYDTGLQWEQKSDDGSVHDKDNAYLWCAPDPSQSRCENPSNAPDGGVFTDFLGALNLSANPVVAATSGCFAGHCDWRLPTIEELQTIRLAPCGASPCIDETAFGPTISAVYWTISGSGPGNGGTWVVQFDDGSVTGQAKKFLAYARAVRSAL